MSSFKNDSSNQGSRSSSILIADQAFGSDFSAESCSDHFGDDLVESWSEHSSDDFDSKRSNQPANEPSYNQADRTIKGFKGLARPFNRLDKDLLDLQYFKNVWSFRFDWR